MLIDAIKRGFGLLSNPENGFKDLQKRQFEVVLGNYLILLLSVSVLTGVVSFLFYLGKAAYLDVLMEIEIEYLRMLNYSMGRSTSLMFFYLFAGTFFVFILSLILAPFFRKMKYVRLLSIIFYSLSPFLLFGWIPIFSMPLLIWSIFLFVVGVRSERFNEKIKKDSIKQRD